MEITVEPKYENGQILYNAQGESVRITERSFGVKKTTIVVVYKVVNEKGAYSTILEPTIGKIWFTTLEEATKSAK